jgi:integrase
MIRKLYRERVPLRWKIIEKETIDEIIFRTTKVRNRLILELMARGGMRIGEVLKLQLGDLQDRKLVLREPKSGKEYEFVFIPQKVADRLREYALEVCNEPSDRIFPISYEAARMMVIKSGKLVGVKLDHMICVGIRQPMHLDLAYLLKLFQKSSSGTRIFRPQDGHRPRGSICRCFCWTLTFSCRRPSRLGPSY